MRSCGALTLAALLAVLVGTANAAAATAGTTTAARAGAATALNERTRIRLQHELFDCSWTRPRSLERARFTGEAALSEAELCSALDPGVVVYNRVPKAGSTTMLHNIRVIQRRSQRFTTAHSQHTSDLLSTEFSRFLNGLVKKSAASGRVLWNRHQAFLAGVSEKAVWMNVVRDPVDREISRYYYLRHSSNRDESQRQKVVTANGDLLLDDCVARHPGKWRQCGVRANSMLPFFCGAGNECQLPWNATAEAKQVALTQAKRNIEQRFAVVGTVERMDDTILLLERRLPGYFKGLAAELARMSAGEAAAGGGRANTNSHPAPTEETLGKMREAFDADYALYEWVRERMDRQLAAC